MTVVSTRAQQVLEGVPLPATPGDLEAYAHRNDASPEILAALRHLPERRYGSLDEVGEAISPVQPPEPPAGRPAPRPHSGAPPGGDAYLDPSPAPGAIRPDPPRGGEAS